MDADAALRGLMTVIDEHRWSAMADFLHRDFECELVHIGETFDRDGWIRMNAEYPDFDRLQIVELVGDSDRAACRSHVTSKNASGTQHFECASFAQVQEGLIIRLTEVWTDVNQVAPPGARPAGP